MFSDKLPYTAGSDGHTLFYIAIQNDLYQVVDFLLTSCPVDLTDPSLMQGNSSLKQSSELGNELITFDLI